MTSTSSDNAAGAQPLYASVDGVAHALGGDECVFQARGSRETHVMTPQVLAALDAARPFRTLTDHAGAIAARNPALSGQIEAIQRVLAHLVQRGLLIRDSDYLAQLGSGAAPTPAAFAGLFIRACERPAQLRRLLDSLAADSRSARDAVRVTVIDASLEPANQRAHAEALAQFGSATGVPTEYFGPDRCGRLRERLARARPEAAAALSQALAGRASAVAGVGAALNLIALLAAGCRYAVLDDAAVFPLAVPEGAGTALTLDFQGEFPARFFASVDAALGAGTALPTAPFSLHLDWCGRGLGALLAGDGGATLTPAALAAFEPSRHPEFGAGTRILASLNGQRGAVGATDPRWLFTLTGESRAQLSAERARYIAQLDAPCAWRGPASPTLLSHAAATPFMLDGARLLPPTVANGRGAELLFGVLSRALHPQSVALHAATTIGQAPSPSRARREPLFAPEFPGFAQYLADWIDPRVEQIRAEDPAQRVAGLSASIEDLAAASQADRIELLHEYLRFRRAERVERLQHAYAEFAAAPVHWQADVRELITVNGRALTETVPPRLADWPEGLDEPACARQLGSDLRDFAALLRHWPALWATAAELGDGLRSG